uniref:TRIO and F-actin binding protein n=1 Tax=Moschus moschiferus TaxID=68415 RepID=A0A8C6E070_MOSMO
MEGVAGNAPCEHFEADVLAQSFCQDCCHPEEAHRARHQEPGRPASAEVPYCDLPRRRPAPEDPLGTPTSSCQSVVGPGCGPEPERWVGPWGLRRGSRGRVPSPIPPHTPS